VARVYISSTFEDLKDHRAAAYHTLRRMGHDSIAMEDYIATERRPLDKCLDDVAHSDLYLGLIGWRYGFVPRHDNAAEQSITELEYRKATEADIPRLIFLLDPSYEWPPEFRDEVTGEGDGGARISTFRRALESEHIRGFFTTPESSAPR
jgi:Domain of unknown function (DUF4062)